MRQTVKEITRRFLHLRVATTGLYTACIKS